MKSLSLKAIVMGVALFSMIGISAATEYSAGMRLGINLSSIYGDSVQNLSPRFGFNISLFVSEWLSEKLGVQEELSIGARGARWTSDPTQSSSTNKAYMNYATDFTYLDIPILAKWRFSSSETARWSLFLGPDFAFPLVAQSNYQGSTMDLKDKTSGFDFDVAAGLSLDIRKDNLIIPIDLRYTLGLTNFAKGDPSIEYTPNLRHGVLSLSVGLGFIKMKKENQDQENQQSQEKPQTQEKPESQEKVQEK